MKNFKPRKSVKRFICETLISALVLTVILGIIYYQERLWVLAMVLIFILDVTTVPLKWTNRSLK